MSESAKKLENIVSLNESSLKQFGVEDYTQELELATPDENVFEGIYNQNQPVKKFFEALNSRYRAILNLGDAGVGKSSLTKNLSKKLQELASGTKITGPFSKEIEEPITKIKNYYLEI